MNEPTQTPSLTDTAFATLRDRYIPQTCLGRKAGRQTWLAIDQVTGDSVVVKRLAFGRDFLWDDLKLFEREAQTLKSIDHPAIPRYLDFFDLESEGEQGFALVQSYIDARSLEEHVKSGRRFSEADLKEIAIQVLDILDYLHHCQPPVIHRDIKPSNILLAESDGGVGIVYLVDFGSVQSLAAREGSTITIVGTYGYMPPEQFGGRAYPTSDFYSLGATLIYLATGKHPADIPQGKDLRLNFEPLANLSLEMTGWLRKMIHPIADERPNSVQKLLDILQNPEIETIQKQTNAQIKDEFFCLLKPFGSKVKVIQNKEELKIVIPHKGHYFFVCIVMGTIWNMISPANKDFFTDFFTVISFGSSSFTCFIYVSALLLSWMSLGLIIIWSILTYVFGSLHLHIQESKILFYWEAFGLKTQKMRIFDRQHLGKIELVEAYISNNGDSSVTNNAQLNLWVGTQPIKLNEYNDLTPPELGWLARELSDFLDLPISHK
jgi:serine/threonine protein kinase